MNEMPGYDLRNFVYSKITIAEETGFITYGTPISLPWARKLSRSAELLQAEKWGDGQRVVIFKKRGKTELDMEVAGLDYALEADLLGSTQDATSKYITENEDDTQPFVALGYAEYLADGRKKVYWELWGSFEPAGEEYETFQGDIALRSRQMKYTGIARPCDRNYRLLMDEDALPDGDTLDDFFTSATLMSTVPAAYKTA